MGRKPTYNPDDYLPEVLEWLGDGKTLRSYCRQSGKPSYNTVYDWLSDPEIEQRFARARVMGQDAIADDCIDIADSEADPQRAKVRIWTRLELLKKWNPKRYGDKVQQEVSGPDGKAVPVSLEIDL